MAYQNQQLSRLPDAPPERVGPSRWRVPSSSPSPDGLETPSGLALPPLQPSLAALLAKHVEDSTTVRLAAFSLGRLGHDPASVADILELPLELVNTTLAADIRRGRAEMTTRLARTVTEKALAGDDSSLKFWLKSRAKWYDTPPPPSQTSQAGGPQITQIILNTGVPGPTQSEPIEITLSKRDYERIPELRPDDPE